MASSELLTYLRCTPEDRKSARAALAAVQPGPSEVVNQAALGWAGLAIGIFIGIAVVVVVVAAIAATMMLARGLALLLVVVVPVVMAIRTARKSARFHRARVR